MNQQNMSKTHSSNGTDLPVKRKRGRPRKDESMLRNEKRQTQQSISMSQPSHISAITNIQQPSAVTMNPIGDSHNVVGQVVTGVIDGVFDAGYLISVRVGPHNTLLRGLVFQQGHFCPITPSNDVAPHLKMSRRENIQIPISNQTQQCNPQTTCAKQSSQLAMPVTMQNYQTSPMMAGPSSNSAPPPENLRMVEQDELMQVFEVSKMVEQPPKNDDCSHGMRNDNFLSDSDLMAESLHRNDVVKNPNLHCGGPLVHEIGHESVIEEVDMQTQREAENPEHITRVETVIEEATSIEKDILPHECEKKGMDIYFQAIMLKFSTVTNKLYYVSEITILFYR